MMNLAEYFRNRNTRLADDSWVAHGEGVVLEGDGQPQRTAARSAARLDSAVLAELVAVAGRLNTPSAVSAWLGHLRRGAAARRRHLSGQHVRRQRLALVDAERKADFEEAGAHFESSYFLTSGLPPVEDAARAETWPTRAVIMPASMRTRSCAASQTAPIASSSSSTLSCRNALGSMTRETLTYLVFDRLDEGTASASPRHQCISMRFSPISR